MKTSLTKLIAVSALALSVIIASGCSADGVDNTTGNANSQQSSSVNSIVTPEQSYQENESEPDITTVAVEQTEPVLTTAASESTKAESVKPSQKNEWTESKTSSEKYVTVDCYSRRKALLGAETAKLYRINDKVKIVATTDTGYSKLEDGTFIHNDYLSDSKVMVTTLAVSTTTVKPAEQKPSSNSSDSSGYSWVIKPTYDYDDVNVLCDMEYKPIGDITLWDDNTGDHDSGKKLPVGYVITKNNKCGLISQNGDVLMDCDYKFISTFSNFIEALKTNDGNSYTLGSDYKVHIMESYGHGAGATYYIYDTSNNRMGYIDPVVSRIYDEEDAEIFADRTLLLKSGTINVNNNNVREDGDDVAKFGLMYRNKVIVPLIYDGGSDGNLIEYVDDSMKTIDVKDGRAVFWKNNKIYVFDKDGKCYSDGKYDKVDNGNQELNYFNGYLTVCKNGKWGLIDVNGKEVLKCQFEDISSVYDGKAWAKQNGKWGLIKLA